MRVSGGDDDGMAFESEIDDKSGGNPIIERTASIAASNLVQSGLPQRQEIPSEFIDRNEKILRDIRMALNFNVNVR